jgi:hypothetical protein
MGVMMKNPTRWLRNSGIPPVRLSRSLPCLGGTLLTGVTENGVVIAIVPTSKGWVAEFDDSNETRECRTVVEARVWLSWLDFGFTRKVADELTDKMLKKVAHRREFHATPEVTS